MVGAHLHYTLSLMLCYRPIDPLSICAAPGVTFEDEEVLPSVHLELTYEFDLRGFHLGPTIGFAYNPEDMHISLGLHTGFAF